MKIADITIYRGTKKVIFFNLGIYTIIKNELGYRYTKHKGKGLYLKFEKGIYRESSFNEIQDSIRYYFETNFSKLEINGDISYEDFINNFFHKRPIRNGHFSRSFLSEDFELNEFNHAIK